MINVQDKNKKIIPKDEAILLDSHCQHSGLGRIWAERSTFERGGEHKKPHWKILHESGLVFRD